MKYYPFLFLLTFLVLGNKALAQTTQSPEPAKLPPPMLTLYEEDGSGKERVIDAKGIVNINSTIHIVLNTVEISREIAGMEGISSDERFLKLDAINQILAYETDILRILNNGFSEITEYDELLYLSITLLSLSDSVYEAIQKYPWLEDEYDSEASQARVRMVRERGGSQIEQVLDFLAFQAETLGKEIEESLDPSVRTYFRLGAFLKNSRGGRPVHIENFDDYDQGEYKEFAQFGRGLSEPENKALKKTEEHTEDLEGELEKMQSFLESRLEDPLPSKEKLKTFLAEVKSSRDSLDEEAINFLDKNLSGPEELANSYRAIEGLVGGLGNTFSNMFAGKSEGGGGASFGDDIINRVEKVEVQVITGFNQFESAYSGYTRDLEKANKTAAPEMQKLVTDYAAFKETALEDLSGLKKVLMKLNELLNPFRRTYLASEELGEEVKRFTAGTLPREGFIDLRYIGERRPGDEVLVKAVLERGEKGEIGYKVSTVSRQFLKMERIAVYSRLGAGLVLANPYNRANNPDIALDKNFQFTPSFSIFFKWGSRKSRFYNNFLAFGLGLNFTSPDFNLDGTPEFGAGAVITGMRDILNAGWGWNFGVDAPYYFIGFNIPFNFPANFSGSTQVDAADL